jgi:hypothetical protein
LLARGCTNNRTNSWRTGSVKQNWTLNSFNELNVLIHTVEFKTELNSTWLDSSSYKQVNLHWNKIYICRPCE